MSVQWSLNSWIRQSLLNFRHINHTETTNEIIASLPKEIIKEIFKNLNYRQICILARVNHHFRDIANSVIYEKIKVEFQLAICGKEVNSRIKDILIELELLPKESGNSHKIKSVVKFIFKYKFFFLKEKNKANEKFDPLESIKFVHQFQECNPHLIQSKTLQYKINESFIKHIKNGCCPYKIQAFLALGADLK